MRQAVCDTETSSSWATAPQKVWTENVDCVRDKKIAQKILIGKPEGNKPFRKFRY
jgi:hypothetical protein